MIMKTQNVEEHKLIVLDKRIESFFNGYRQNLVLFSDDAEEIGYLLDRYFADRTLPNMALVRLSAAQTDRRWLIRNFCLSLLTSYFNLAQPLDELINRAQGQLPATIALTKQALGQENVPFSTLLEIINSFITESGKRCLLIVEQFNGLKDIFPAGFDEFSRFIILQRQCMVILTTSHRQESETIISGELNLLFGNFEKINLTESAFSDNYHYLTGLLTPAKPSRFFSAYLIDMVGSNILYYRHFCEDLQRREPEEDTKLLSTLVHDRLFSPRTYFFQKFLKHINVIEATHRTPAITIKILLALAQGYLRKTEIAALNLCDKKSLDTRLLKLCDQGYATSYGTIYKVCDRLFSFWLARVFYYYLTISDPAARYRLWALDLQNNLELYHRAFLSAKLEQITALLMLFRDDTLDINEHSYKLSAVNRTKVLTVPPTDGLNIIVGEGREIMFVGVKETDAKDSDIFTFGSATGAVKSKGVKRFFVSLGTIGDNARLAAKNQKFTSWDLNDLNRLMRIYNLPAIMPETSNASAGSL